MLMFLMPAEVRRSFIMPSLDYRTVLVPVFRARGRARVATAAFIMADDAIARN